MSSFSVILTTSNSTAAPYVFNATTGTYTFDVNLRDMIPPKAINSRFQMRFVLTSVASASVGSDSVWGVSINLNNAIINTQINGLRAQHYGVVPLANNVGAVASYTLNATADTNAPVVVERLGEVYSIVIKLMKNYAALTTTSVSYCCVVYFDEIV